jgi:hypothetical protein
MTINNRVSKRLFGLRTELNRRIEYWNRVRAGALTTAEKRGCTERISEINSFYTHERIELFKKYWRPNKSPEPVVDGNRFLAFLRGIFKRKA